MQTINLIKEIDRSINYREHLVDASQMQFTQATVEETKALEQLNSNNKFGFFMGEFMFGVVALLAAIVVAINFGFGAAVVICLIFAAPMAGIAYFCKTNAPKYNDFSISKVLVIRRQETGKRHYLDIWSEEQQAYVESIPVSGPHGNAIRVGEPVYAIRATSDKGVHHMVISMSDFNLMLYQTGGMTKPLE